MDHSYLNDILILFLAAVTVVVFCLRVNLPPILGYLSLGVLMGPYGFGLVKDTETIRTVAEFGVVFLLFTIGLEFSMAQLIRMKGAVLGLGGGQVILTTAAAAGVSMYFGMSVETSLILGGVVAMSSTALVIKQLTDQVELHSRHGRNAVGILLFQDVMVIPFLILVSMPTGGDATSMTAVFSAVAQGLLALVLIIFVGRWVLRPVFHGIAKFRSMELFTLSALLVTLGAAWLTGQLGLSLALGAFIAGMLMGETEYRHQVEAEIRPFRDILLGLFFVTVGMLFDISLLPDIWMSVLMVLAGLVIFKLVLVFALCRIAGWDDAVSLRTGMVLAHGGEFGFAILTLALQGNMISQEVGQTMLAALLISMGIAPLVIRANGQLAGRFLPKALEESKHSIEDKVADTAHGLSNHVIICGYGRMGQNVASFLDSEDIGFIAMDLDPVLVQNAVKAKEPVTYGDSASLDLLKAAGLTRASAVVVSLDDVSTALKIVHQVRRVERELPILVRTQDDSKLQELIEAGATEVIPETLESSLMMASHLLFMLHVPMSRVIHKIQRVRRERYQVLRRLFPGEGVVPEMWDQAADDQEQLRALELQEDSWAVPRAINELELDDLHVMLVALQRNGERIQKPATDMRLQAGDTLVVCGTPVALEHAEDKLLRTSIS